LLVNLFALIVALSVDLTTQLVFFTSWAALVRTFATTVATVAVIATPVALVFGRAQRELQIAKRRLEEISRTDPLTGLPKRWALLEASEAPALQTMVLVIVDIDRFKLVNDKHGHRTSDLVLQMIGNTMATHLSDFGLVGRLGSEEFALISSHTPVERVVAAIGDLLRTLARTPINHAGRGGSGDDVGGHRRAAIRPRPSKRSMRTPTRRCPWQNALAETGSGSHPGRSRLFCRAALWGQPALT
jgi:diguanylate cyclase (GGDEF)-like protein